MQKYIFELCELKLKKQNKTTTTEELKFFTRSEPKMPSASMCCHPLLCVLEHAVAVNLNENALLH